MQTPDQINAKIAEMLQKAPDFIHTEVERLLRSGAVNLDDADDNFVLPKLLYVTALRRLAEQYTPAHYDQRGKRKLKNLDRF